MASRIAPQKAVDVSLIICTRNRGSQLARSLAAVNELATGLSWELVIVDNGSTDNTADVVRAYAGSCLVRPTCVRESEPGLGWARNAGINASSGRFVAFIDDDCYPASDFLSRLVECFEEAPETLAFVGGRVLLFDSTDLPITIQTCEKRKHLTSKSFIVPGVIHGANMGFRRSALIDVRGFDVRLGSGTPFVCDDVDLLARLVSRGWHGVYDPRPLVWHHHGRKTSAEGAAIERVYDAGRGAYYVKCLMTSELRALCARHWLRSSSHLPPMRTVREITGALHYLVDLGIQWFLGEGSPPRKSRQLDSRWVT